MSEPNTAEKIVTRFAPSPTGYLHIGGARTALFNWAFARRHGGTFILRIEDTDKARSTPQATRQIIQDLQWLGIDWDEGPDPNAADVYDIKSQLGSHGPYFQSQRNELYKKYLQQLIDSGRAYEENGAWRFKMFAEGQRKPITVHDLILGDVTKEPSDLEDFIIFKGAASGGGPTFHFANVVDDATMRVTHVLRAQEHLNNTHKHVALFEALGLTPPRYAHMPLIFNPDGTKMSKRDKAKTARNSAQLWLKQPGNTNDSLTARSGAAAADLTAFLAKETDSNEIAVPLAASLGVTLPEIDVNDFKQTGYPRDVLLNYVALLGWNPGGNVERFDLDYLKKEYDLARMGKSNAKFDRAKLLAFNAETLQKMPADEFLSRWKAHLSAYQPEFVQRFNDDELRQLAAMYQPRCRTLSEPVSSAKFFVLPDDAITFDAKAWTKNVGPAGSHGHTALTEAATTLSAIDSWNAATIHNALEKLATDTSRKIGDIAQPLRVAVTGTAVSPAIQDTLTLLGKTSTLTRIARCLAHTPTP